MTLQGSLTLLPPIELLVVSRGQGRAKIIGVLRSLCDGMDWRGCRYFTDKAAGRQHVCGTV